MGWFIVKTNKYLKKIAKNNINWSKSDVESVFTTSVLGTTSVLAITDVVNTFNISFLKKKTDVVYDFQHQFFDNRCRKCFRIHNSTLVFSSKTNVVFCTTTSVFFKTDVVSALQHRFWTKLMFVFAYFTFFLFISYDTTSIFFKIDVI